MSEQKIEPDHMTVAARNNRLYDTLKGMGLFVTPVPREDFPNEIDYIVVSCHMPGGSRELVARDVCLPLQGSKVGEGIAPSVSDGSNVVDFPPML